MSILSAICHLFSYVSYMGFLGCALVLPNFVNNAIAKYCTPVNKRTATEIESNGGNDESACNEF